MSELQIYPVIPATSVFPAVQPEPLLKCSVEWNTLVTEIPRKGHENRRARLTEPMFRIEGSDFVLTDSSYATLSTAFTANEGKGTSFPFKCPMDYYCTATPEYYDSTTVYQQGILVQLTGNNYQIVKRYTVNGVHSYKTIIYPVGSTVKVYSNGTLITSGLTVNTGTGVVSSSSPLSGTLTVDCEFRLPMRFDVDDLQLTQIKRQLAAYGGDRNVYTTINFRLVEDNYNKLSPLLSNDWTSNISYDFSAGALPHLTYSDRILTLVESADNQKENREIIPITRKAIKMESSNQSWNELQRCYTLFNVAKGKLLRFGFESIGVRFDQDVFTSSRLGDKTWTFDGLSMIQVLRNTNLEALNLAHFIKLETSFNRAIGDTGGGNNSRTFSLVVRGQGWDLSSCSFNNWMASPPILPIQTLFTTTVADYGGNFYVERSNPVETFGTQTQTNCAVGSPAGTGFPGVTGTYYGYKIKYYIRKEDGTSVATFGAGWYDSDHGKVIFSPKLTLLNPSIGFTSLDRDIEIDGVIYKANTALDPTAIKQDYEAQPNNFEAKGFITSDLISDVDIRAGKYNDSRIELFIGDFITKSNVKTLQKGTWGEVTKDGLTFRATIHTNADKLSNPIRNVLQESCRYPGRLDNPYCTVNKFDFAIVGTITGGITGRVFNTDQTIASNRLRMFNWSSGGGYIIVLGGDNAGLTLDIDNVNESGVVTLLKLPPYPFQVGDKVQLVPGCDGTFYSCGLFNNTKNFGGIPTGGNFFPTGTDLRS